jgi:hypothetical protein
MASRYICPKSIKQDRDIKYRLEEKNAQRKTNRNKILEKNRQIIPNENETNQLNDTYVVPEVDRCKIKLFFFYFN